MNQAMQQFERFIVAMPCIVVISVTVLAIVLKMVSGDFPAMPGLGAIVVLIGVMFFCVNPPHPVVPGVALVVVIGMVVSFPFLEKQLELREQRSYDLGRLERAFAALAQKEDNPSAAFDAARWLWQQGFRQDAMAIAEATLAKLDTRRDEIRNTSMREMFRTEESMLRLWKREPMIVEPASARTCSACKKVNEAGALKCAGCQRWYLLDKARLASFKDKVMVRLIVSYAVICGMIVGGAAIGMAVDGVLRWVAVGVAVLIVGGFLAWLLKPPSAMKA
jgi:hypothetical protein